MRVLSFLIPVVLWAQADPAVRRCTVEGVVVQEMGGEALRQVEIGLVPVRERKPGQPAPAAIGVYSDSNGHFRIPELEPGVYRVRLRKEGFSPTLPSGTIVLPKLEPGQELGNLKFTMAPQAVLGGRVLDDNGDPAANASVGLIRTRSVRGRPVLNDFGGVATTDDRGVFRMAGIDPGRYLLSVDDLPSRDIVFPAGGGMTAYVTTYYPGVSDPAQAQTLEVGRGMVETGLEIRLLREAVFPVSGRAVDANGVGLANFVVTARRVRSGPTMYLGGSPRRFSDGVFSLPGLRAGTWILEAKTAGLSAQGPRGVAMAEIQVGGGALDDVVLRTMPAQQVNGTAVLEGAGGMTPDWAQVGISVLEVEGGFGGRGAAPDASGAFAMPIHGAGKAWVHVTGIPAAGTYLAQMLVGGQDVTSQELDIPAGGLAPLRLVFRPGAATLTGRAETADPNVLAGRPVISLWPAEAGQRDGRAAVTGRFQADGTFTITDIRPGEYLVYAGFGYEPGPFGSQAPPEDLESRSTRVKLAPGSTQAIQIKLPVQGGLR